MELTEKRRMFEEEYPRLFAQIYRYIRYRVPHAQDAEDLLADTMLQAYAKLRLFDAAKGSLAQWLTGFARHRVQDHWRRRRVTISIEEIEGTLADVGREAEDLDDQLLVERIMAALPAEAKALIAMRFIDGLTHEEIARSIGKDPRSVRQFFSRLQRQLRLENEAAMTSEPS